MRVLIFISSFSRGGAARVTSTLCQELVNAEYEVHIATNTSTEPIFYPLPTIATIHSFYVSKDKLGLWGSIKLNINYCKLARQIIRKVKPDVIIGVEPRTFLYAKMGAIGYNAPVIASDHTSFSRKQDFITNFIRYKFYGVADALTILTKKDYNLLGHKFPNKVVIYNPLSFPVLNTPTCRKKNILCAGRLDVWHIKGFDIILQCWQNLADKYPDWILEIAGDGSKESTSFLKQAIEDKGLTDRVVLLGQVEDMQSKFSQTSIFALPSRVEGFPMVLMEAMSQGCACISYEVGGAIQEMITDNKDGIIVRDLDISGFTERLSLLIADATLRDKLSSNAIKSVQRFSTESFIASWNRLLNQLVNRPKA